MFTYYDHSIWLTCITFCYAPFPQHWITWFASFLVISPVPRDGRGRSLCQHKGRRWRPRRPADAGASTAQHLFATAPWWHPGHSWFRSEDNNSLVRASVTPDYEVRTSQLFGGTPGSYFVGRWECPIKAKICWPCSETPPVRHAQCIPSHPHWLLLELCWRSLMTLIYWESHLC